MTSKGMMKMNPRALLALFVGKSSSFVLKNFFKKGTTLPGRLALKIDPHILKSLSKNTRTIIITGTNGKTTTASLVYHMFQNASYTTFSNEAGANMITGVTTSFIENYHLFNSKEKIAVMEVDEANVPFVCQNITPEVVCITNLFRDQLDRYGEVYTTLEKILSGVRLHDSTTLVLNGDEPMLGSLKEPNKKIFFGFNVSNNNEKIESNTDAKNCINCKTPYRYKFITYNHLGNYECPNCGYRRPDLTYHVDEIKEMLPSHSTVVINGHEVNISQSGMYNIYNALCAYSIADVFHIDESIVEKTISKQESRFGRQEMVKLGDKEMMIFLVKNPAGFNQTIDTIALDNGEFTCIFLLNDNLADGTDISWIYDVHLEKLASLNIRQYLIGGLRAYDMAIRLDVATKQRDILNVYEDYDSLTQAALNAPTKKIYATLTYTAMLSYRKYLQEKGYIKDYWK